MKCIEFGRVLIIGCFLTGISSGCVAAQKAGSSEGKAGTGVNAKSNSTTVDFETCDVGTVIGSWHVIGVGEQNTSSRAHKGFEISLREGVYTVVWVESMNSGREIKTDVCRNGVLKSELLPLSAGGEIQTCFMHCTPFDKHEDGSVRVAGINSNFCRWVKQMTPQKDMGVQDTKSGTLNSCESKEVSEQTTFDECVCYHVPEGGGQSPGTGTGGSGGD